MDYTEAKYHIKRANVIEAYVRITDSEGLYTTITKRAALLLLDTAEAFSGDEEYNITAQVVRGQKVVTIN